jgi:nicotinate-nucleotide pyrophosphorylase (carboxylating)
MRQDNYNAASSRRAKTMTHLPDTLNNTLSAALQANVRAALAEDLGNTDLDTMDLDSTDLSALSGDRTAQLIPANAQARARVITREKAILCGTAWFDACFHMLDARVKITWQARDGEAISAGQTLCELVGPARALLSGERPALNFLQTLSGVATETQRYVAAVAGTSARIYDTRKTLPGLRQALKYAVKCGGGENQRIGLYDGILIKENHIAAAGGIQPALHAAARLIAGKTGISLQIEVENLAQLNEALTAGANLAGTKLILLDNFDLAALRDAVQLTAGRAVLEASGGVDLATVRAIAATGVDRISIGNLTKSVRALDLSLRFF